MRLMFAGAVAVATLCACFLGLSSHAVQADGTPLVTASINVTNAEVLPEDGALVRAFIPTGSSSVKCLVSMNESTFATLGTQVFCGQRTSAQYGQGILITISYADAVPPNYGTSLTVWQQGARYYGPPIMCETAGAC